MTHSTTSKSKSLFTIRRADRLEIPFFLSLAENEGWNPGLEDAGPFYAADPNGFFIGELEGEKIGCVSGIAYNNNYGFAGLYIVKPEFRQQGFGIQLYDHVMAYLKGRTIGLDGVVEQQSNYKKSGFKFFYRNVRFEGIGGFTPSASFVDLKKQPLDMIVKYDFPIFGAQRKSFLNEWIQMSNASSLGIMHQNQLSGYGVIRSCTKGYKIGPLFADSYEIALELYLGLCSKAEQGSSIFLDVPEINSGALELAKQFKMKKVFETARMYSGNPPPQKLEKVYGITTFELG